MRHLDLLRRLPSKTIGCKNWVQKLLEVVKTPNRPNQRPKMQLLEQGDLFCQSTIWFEWQEIENVANLTAKAPMKEQGDLFSSCVPVSVKRLDQDKDAENVDADHVRTGRLDYEQFDHHDD